MVVHCSAISTGACHARVNMANENDMRWRDIRVTERERQAPGRAQNLRE
jgi:hypothetical protein